MQRRTSEEIILLGVLAFSFAYRLLLMTWNTFPPGADIGLHESVIKSITNEKTSLFWNPYHMGGGISVTNPGYHIFTAFVIAFTGAPDYLAQAMVSSLFSAAMALCAFLIVRRLWNKSAALVAAFLVAFSRSDISILSWGGYPNIVTLMLIPLVFYMFFNYSRFSTRVHIAVTSLLVSAIFLTHLFSAFVFVTIAAIALFFSAVTFRRTSSAKLKAVSWLVPILAGFLLVSPYLLETIPIYFSSEGAITGAVSLMKNAVIETRLVPIEVFLLALVPTFLFFLLSKVYRRRLLTAQAILFSIWVLVPAAMTQSHLLGLYLDYERFIYFLEFPAIIFIALLIFWGSKLITKTLHLLFNKVNKKDLKTTQTREILTYRKSAPKAAFATLVLLFLFVSVFYVPMFAAPSAGIKIVESYQVMSTAGYEAIQWIKTNTPPSSVCVADAEFGWWLSGFACRPTLSAVDPQYLILSREFEPATAAADILRAGCFIDNGLVRVVQTGTYLKADQHQLMAKTNTSYVVYPFFSLGTPESSFVYLDKGAPKQLELNKMPIVETVFSNNSDRASFTVTRSDQVFDFVEEITVYKGIRFIQYSLKIQTKAENVGLSWLHLPFQSRGIQMQYANSIAWLDESIHGFSQIVFSQEQQLGDTVIIQENPHFLELVYDLKGKASVKIEFYVGFFNYLSLSENDKPDFINRVMAKDTESCFIQVSDLPLEYFDYQKAIRDWNVSFIAVRNMDFITRFVEDPMFNLVFKNSEVAVFQVRNSAK
jgi:hypothetical protein